MNSERDDALLDVALAIADGAEVAWPDIRSQFPPEDDRVVTALQAVSRLKALRHALGRDQETVPRRWGHLTILDASAGTSGARYTARDDALGREVVLTLSDPLDGDAARTEQLLTRARARTRVAHPNLAALYGADYVHDRVGYWAEQVPGCSLAEFTATGGRVGTADACGIVATLCGAVAAVHAAGLVDGGISPAHVVDAGDRFVLLPSVCAEVKPGSPAHCSPAADVVALAGLLYYLLTARPLDSPVDTATLRDTLLQGRPDLREPIAQVLTNALATDSRHGYTSASELEAAIRAAARDTFDSAEVVIGFVVTLLVFLLLLWYAFATK